MGLYETIMKYIPVEPIQNIVMYGVSGFALGFFYALATGQPQNILSSGTFDVAMATGAYQAACEIAAYLKSCVPVPPGTTTTVSTPVVAAAAPAPKKPGLLERMI